MGKLKHGNSRRAGRSAEYWTWARIMQRCYNPNRDTSKYYHGRGIKVEKRWHEFRYFLEDMGLRPKGCSLDRIDTNRGYSRSNCRWASRIEQMNNRRNSRILLWDGKHDTLPNLARFISLNQKTFRTRLADGWSVERIMTTPARRLAYHK